MAQRMPSDEDRLVAEHESTKAAVERDLHSDVALKAETEVHKDRAQIDEMAAKVKDKAVAEVRDAESIAYRRKKLARVVQVIDFIFTVIYVLLGTRLLLGMMAADSDAGFVQLIRSLTEPFFAMFKGIVATPTAEGGHVFALPILVAIGAWALLHWLVRSIAKLIAYRRSEI